MSELRGGNKIYLKALHQNVMPNDRHQQIGTTRNCWTSSTSINPEDRPQEHSSWPTPMTCRVLPNSRKVPIHQEARQSREICHQSFARQYDTVVHFFHIHHERTAQVEQYQKHYQRIELTLPGVITKQMQSKCTRAQM